MHDEHPHPLLAQVPLTVSPFLSLPTATPLPYTYKQLPSTLPPSILQTTQTTPTTSQHDPSSTPQPPQQQQQHHKPAYIHSATGTSAHPDQILASCLALQSHLQTLEADARKTLSAFEERRRAEELAEKRRVAPGWLDGDVRILRPENVGDEAGGGDTEMSGMGGMGTEGHAGMSVGIKALVERRDGVPDEGEGQALDRAFGGLHLK
ncbi:hypothetical protein CC80DRAFT_512692 [Byssothecium circinans]|uniref:Uncharacterized protein n=1 Tax=Byssothecium circinans TaxID=147558 RepID=A0A6A5UN89_9PLEO|nr:hypothetical protein CC80DRAFT_512692 [Byssothecium circinans]